MTSLRSNFCDGKSLILSSHYSSLQGHVILLKSMSANTETLLVLKS